MAQILLIEPNRLLASQYREYLNLKGHTVYWAQNAQEAINQADLNKPELVILELLLSSHSGIEFLYEFRSYVEWRDIPVLILSRMERDDIKASDKVLGELGVAAYLYKPDTSLERLLKRIYAVTSAKHAKSS